MPYNSRTGICRLLAERYDVKSNVNLNKIHHSLKHPMCLATLKSWIQQNCLSVDEIYIYIYIYIYICVCVCVCVCVRARVCVCVCVKRQLLVGKKSKQNILFKKCSLVM